MQLLPINDRSLIDNDDNAIHNQDANMCDENNCLSFTE